MSKDITGNPWILDAAEEIVTRPVYVKRMVWTPTTDGDDLLIVDHAGGTVWTLKAIAADSNQGIEYEKVIDGTVNGMTITTIDNGTVYVYVR